MQATAPSCDIFCVVVDNFGDAAVSWRLSRQLAEEHGWKVRLWIDDLAPLQQLVPDYDTLSVDVRRWPSDPGGIEVADVVIEAFACELPAAYLEAMARRVRAPIWINLEYLSAEPWVKTCHARPSPHPSLPLLKHFFFPGFGPDTGGLLREADYDQKRSRFDEAAFRKEFGLPPRAPGELTISVFAYARNSIPALLSGMAASARPIRILTPGHPAPVRQEAAVYTYGLPFLPQSRFDELLWASDLNFVRGEDSFVRAQWAGKPFVWQIYPQEDDTHLVKLDAFLDLYGATPVMRRFWHAWNGNAALDWREFCNALPEQAGAARRWENALKQSPELSCSLVEFCRERLK